MKKIQVLIIVAMMFSLSGFLSAGEMLDIKGSFGELNEGVTAGWTRNRKITARIRGDWDIGIKAIK